MQIQNHDINGRTSYGFGTQRKDFNLLACGKKDGCIGGCGNEKLAGSVSPVMTSTFTTDASCEKRTSALKFIYK